MYIIYIILYIIYIVIIFHFIVNRHMTQMPERIPIWHEMYIACWKWQINFYDYDYLQWTNLPKVQNGSTEFKRGVPTTDPSRAGGRGLFLHTTQLTLPLLEGGVCSHAPLQLSIHGTSEAAASLPRRRDRALAHQSGRSRRPIRETGGHQASNRLCRDL